MKPYLFLLLLLPLASAGQSREGFNPADFRPMVGIVGGKPLYGAFAGVMYTKLNVYETGLFAEVAHVPSSNRTPLALVWKNHFKLSREGVSPMLVLNFGQTIKPNGQIVELGGAVKGEAFNFLGSQAKMVISVAYRFAMVPYVDATWAIQGVPLMGSGVVVRVGIEL